MPWISIAMLTVIVLGIQSFAGEPDTSRPDVIWKVERIQQISELTQDEQSFVSQILEEQSSWPHDLVAYVVLTDVNVKIERRVIVAPRNAAVRVGSRIQVEGQWTILRQSADFGIAMPQATVEAVERIGVVNSG